MTPEQLDELKQLLAPRESLDTNGVEGIPNSVLKKALPGPPSVAPYDPIRPEQHYQRQSDPYMSSLPDSLPDLGSPSGESSLPPAGLPEYSGPGSMFTRLLGLTQERKPQFDLSTEGGRAAKEYYDLQSQLSPLERTAMRRHGGVLQFANQRTMRAQQMQQLEEQKRQYAFQEVMSIDKELANEPEKWQMAMEQRATAGNMFAQTMIQAGAKQIAGDFAEVAEAVQKLYPKIAKQYETNPKSVSPSTMKSVIKASHDFVVKKRDATLKETAVREDMQALIDKVTQNPGAVTTMEANTLKQFYDEEEKRKLTLEELKQKITATKAPKEVYSGIQGAQGESVTGIFDPKTGQVRELRGTPIQRVQTDEPKFTPEQAARVSAMNQTLNNLADLRSTLIPDGQKVDRGVLFTSMFGGLPFTGGRDVERYVEDAIETKLRLQTGAAANREEVVKEAKKFKPSQLDTDATIIGKFDKLERYMQDTFNVLDPSGVVRARLGEAGGNIGQPPIPFEQAYENLKKSRPGWSNTDIFKELQRRGVRP